MEAAGGGARGLLRAHVHTTEHHFGVNLDPECPAVAWLARHVY